MPLPSDPTVVETSKNLVTVLKDIFHPPSGVRPAHAKGILLSGTFEPTQMAATLSSAKHFNQPSTPIIARFSSSTGFNQISDTDTNGNPHGFALRFQLENAPRRLHTDIVTHSTPFFPTRTGGEFLDFLRHIKDGKADAFLATHPKARAFIQAPKPSPISLAKENYFGVNAFRLVSKIGVATSIRYRVIPQGGAEHISDEELEGKGPNFLYDQIPALVAQGPITFKLLAQIAEVGDVTNDATEHWPEDRPLVELGIIKLDTISSDNEEEQRRIIFDPIPRDVEGLAASDDPLLEVRAGVYLVSGRERRAAQ